MKTIHSSGASFGSILGADIGSHLGCAGAFLGHIPASSQVLLSFRVLQGLHAVTMLRHSVRPPALRGTTWSYESWLAGFFCPQYWQQYPSRR
jgi:hypothetical protein